MVKIKDGYGEEHLEIRIHSTGSNDKFEVWIEQRSKVDSSLRDETLSYANTEELIELRDSINNAIRERIGL